MSSNVDAGHAGHVARGLYAKVVGALADAVKELNKREVPSGASDDGALGPHDAADGADAAAAIATNAGLHGGPKLNTTAANIFGGRRT
jgi:hypothetical protein